MKGLSRRNALLWSAAMTAAPWHSARGQAEPLPRFSSAVPGAGLPPGWMHETLPKVERANTFAVVPDGGISVLRVRSRASASSLVATSAAAATTARLQWRWKVSGAVAGSDVRSKAGDDYAARLYVLFDLPLARMQLADRLRLQAARSLSGRDIPAAALCYVWGTAQPAGSTAWNPYTDRVRMVVVDSGNDHAMQWRSVQRDLRADWAEAFGGAMPAVSAVAVGADTDNTGGSVDAWFGDLLLAAG